MLGQTQLDTGATADRQMDRHTSQIVGASTVLPNSDTEKAAQAVPSLEMDPKGCVFVKPSLS